LVGPTDNEYGRITRIDGLVDIWTELGNAPDVPETKTCPANKPSNANSRIDYCFTTRNLAEKAVSMRVDQSAQGSNHEPITIEF
jgi:endonuclease/exonuclease/phosphatase family metal-dependent hydrolase